MHSNFRVSIERLDRGELPSIQENIQSTVQRLASKNPVQKPNTLKDTTSTGKGYIASRIDPRQRRRPLSIVGTPTSFQQDDDEIDGSDDEDEEEYDFSISSRRSPQIDGERIVLQHNLYGVAYVGQVGIGSPPQYFHLEFDLTTADTWITQLGGNCTNPAPCPPKRRLFNPARSSTFELSPDLAWTTTATGTGIRSGWEGKNEAKGTLRTDVVQVAGFVVDRQVVGVADTVAGFGEKGVDGVFGLGLHQLSAHGNATPVENLIATSDMKSEIGVWLGSRDSGGELSFGEADPLRYTGEMTYIDLPPEAVYWSVPVRSILINRKPPPPPPPPAPPKPGQPSTTAPPPAQPVKPTPPSPIVSATRDPKKSKKPPHQRPSIIFDTSSDLILLPPTIAFKTHQYLHNFLFGWYSGYSYLSGAYTVPCSLDTDLWVDLGPVIPVVVGSSGIAGGPPPGPGEEELKGVEKRWFKIEAKDIVRGKVPVFGVLGVCFSGVQASQSEDDDWVFGTNWFMGNYMVFDHLKRRVGIATSQRP
ncbi:hypothetical protein EC957_007368 [Mortierella hygrophila]|uniref:Peptidase A1 domain-containing protein n=1 Tax=Mortierella hygrophila TaxID=979708 RepID=A0A9P6EYQ9_9FUNG|nr:hypothetical protein EC957_007368 [Mortierella hygrophila]